MAFPTRLLGCQGGEGLSFPHLPRRLKQPRGSTWGQRGGPSSLCPGPRVWEPGLPSPEARTPSPRAPPFAASPPGAALRSCPGVSGLPGSLAPPRGVVRETGEGLALQPRPLRCPPTDWDPGLQAQAPGTLPKQHTSLPPESRNPLPTPRLRKHPELPGAGLEGGRGPARQAAEGKGAAAGAG